MLFFFLPYFSLRSFLEITSNLTWIRPKKRNDKNNWLVRIPTLTLLLSFAHSFKIGKMLMDQQKSLTDTSTAPERDTGGKSPPLGPVYIPSFHETKCNPEAVSYGCLSKTWWENTMKSDVSKHMSEHGGNRQHHEGVVVGPNFWGWGPAHCGKFRNGGGHWRWKWLKNMVWEVVEFYSCISMPWSQISIISFNNHQ